MDQLMPPYHRIWISCKMRSTRVEPVLLSRLQCLLFSAKVNHLIKCAFYTNTPLKRPKQETIRIYVINCMPCCNFSVNIGFLAAHKDRNTVKL